MAAYITVGATTTHGGKVISGSPHTVHNGIPVSRKGDKVLCKKCKKIATIVTGDSSFIVDGAPIARGGDMTSCGAKLIAAQQSFCESDFEVMAGKQTEDTRSNLYDEVDSEIEHKRITLTDNGTILTSCIYTLNFTDGSSVSGTSDQKGRTSLFPIFKEVKDIEIEIQRGI